MVLIDMVK